jgi:hypothetical protein
VNASSFTSGGSLTVAGGASIAKDLYVNGTISSNFLNVPLAQFNYISVGNLNTNLFSVANLISNNNTLSSIIEFIQNISIEYNIDKKNIIKCKNILCNFKKSEENDYCGKHQVDYFKEETEKEGLKVCANVIRGCRNKLNEEYKYSKCEKCLENDRLKSKGIEPINWQIS